jgi:hypothetical protein
MEGEVPKLSRQPHQAADESRTRQHEQKFGQCQEPRTSLKATVDEFSSSYAAHLLLLINLWVYSLLIHILLSFDFMNCHIDRFYNQIAGIPLAGRAIGVDYNMPELYRNIL